MAFFVIFRSKINFFALGAYKLKFSGYAYEKDIRDGQKSKVPQARNRILTFSIKLCMEIVTTQW